MEDKKYKNKEWLYDQYINKQKSTCQIAKEFNIGSHSTVHRWLKYYNIQKYKQYDNRNWLINEYIYKEKSSKQIGNEQRLDKSTIIGLLKKYNIPRRHEIYVKHKQFKNKKWLENEYINKKKSIWEIAKDQETNHSVVHEWLKKHNISRRATSGSEETRKKIGKKNRLYAIARGRIFPNYNKDSCKYFKQFDEMNNTKGFYGKNEYLIKELGYRPDYINFDLKLIVEWDENFHFENLNYPYFYYNCLKEKDIKRQREIEKYFPDFEFIRIKHRWFF